MNINYVNPVNLNLLEDAFDSGIMNTKDITKDFGKNLHLLLSHIKITFVISEISIFEAYMLKRFCDGNFIDLETYMDDNKIDSGKYPVTYRNMQSLFLLNKNIMEDSDVSVKPGVLLFPSKCVEKKCIAIFQGQNILSITGALVRGPGCFFVRLKSEIQNNPNKNKKDIINDLLIESFIKEFYTYMNNKIKYMDLLTDSTLNFAYLNYAKENTNNIISLSHINSIYGEIPFINIDENIYNSSLSKISDNKKELVLEDDNIILDSTEIFFICNTSMYTFMEAFMYLPIGSILESTDVKILYSSDQYIIPKEMLKYKTRVTSIIDKMKNERLSVEKTTAENSNDDVKSELKLTLIDNYNLIPLNTRVQYTVKFKLSEISDILLKWENKIVNDHIYGEENNYLAREILKVVSSMKSYAIAAYKTIMK